MLYLNTFLGRNFFVVILCVRCPFFRVKVKPSLDSGQSIFVNNSMIRVEAAYWPSGNEKERNNENKKRH